MAGNARSLSLKSPGQFLKKCPTLLAITNLCLADSGLGAEPTLPPQETCIWTNGVGTGFLPGVQTFGLEAGGNYGLAILGSRHAHNLVLGDVSYSHMLGPVMGGSNWYRGNWEGRAELFAGAQFSPNNDWFIGLTPHLRYNLATGTRWIPFVDAGAGVTVMGIDQPDLSSVFEFNLQAGTGVHWFVRDKLAVTVEARYFHISDAGMSRPNFGLNGVTGMIGLTWFF